MDRRSTLIATFLCLAAVPATMGQERRETLVLKNGKTVSGEVLEVGDAHVVLGRKVGRGGVRQRLDFDDLDASSLYGFLAAELSPLDREGHRRLADQAFAGGLFATARRHYRHTALDDGTLLPEVEQRIVQCVERHVDDLITRSRQALEVEDFRNAERLTLLAMRRYPGVERVRQLPTWLDEIEKRRAAAVARDRALERKRFKKAEWERAEKALARVDDQFTTARDLESKALRATKQFRTSRRRFTDSLRYLDRTMESGLGLLQSKRFPNQLKEQLLEILDETRAAQIRVRLHVASAYTVRGSYGTALTWVNGALAIDPTDKSALAARGRIEEAAATASARRVWIR